MTKHDTGFDDWFDQLCDLLADQGVNFSDPDAVRDDYDSGKSLFDVIDEIKSDHA